MPACSADLNLLGTEGTRPPKVGMLRWQITLGLRDGKEGKRREGKIRGGGTTHAGLGPLSAVACPF